MKKLILKTAAITFAAIILAGALLFGGLWLFSPATLAKISEDLGKDSAAAAFYARQYDKSGDYKDLHKVCVVIDEHSNSAIAEKYLEKFVTDERYDEYLSSPEIVKAEGTRAVVYYAGKYVVAAFLNNGAERAAELAANLSVKSYSLYDAFSSLLSDAKLAFTRADLEIIKAKILSLNVSEADEEYKNADIKKANDLIDSLSD